MSTSETVSERSGEGRLRLLLMLTAALPILGYLAAELYFLDGELGFPLDDSWIHQTFARNLSQGQGLAYEAGHLVTGSTAPLWTALLSLLFHVPRTYVSVQVTGVEEAIRGECQSKDTRTISTQPCHPFARLRISCASRFLDPAGPLSSL